MRAWRRSRRAAEELGGRSSFSIANEAQALRGPGAVAVELRETRFQRRGLARAELIAVAQADARIGAGAAEGCAAGYAISASAV